MPNYEDQIQYGYENNEIGFSEPGSQIRAFSWLWSFIVHLMIIKSLQLINWPWNQHQEYLCYYKQPLQICYLDYWHICLEIIVFQLNGIVEESVRALLILWMLTYLFKRNYDHLWIIVIYYKTFLLSLKKEK